MSKPVARRRQKKDKQITLRVTALLLQELSETKAKCEQHGVKVNISKTLSQALEREIRALQKQIREVDPNWLPGQQSFELDN